MRTAVTLDPDVEQLLRKAMRRRGETFKQVLNEGLRTGLGTARTAQRAPLPQPTFDMGRALVNLDKATALAALALEHSAEVGTLDRDFTRFAGLRVQLLS